MLRAYGIDAHDPATTPRRLALALQYLPAGCWPDPEHPASWTVEAYLLAGLVDAVRELTYLTAKVNGVKQAKRPEPVWRPGAKAPKAQGGKVAWGDFGRALGQTAAGVGSRG